MFDKPSKADVEHRYLKRFLANPTTGINATNAERANDPPDFSLIIGGKSVSLEITRIFDQRLKEREEFINRIIRQAWHLFRSKYKTDLYCLITFLNVELDGGQQMFQKFSQQLFLEIEKLYIANSATEFNVTVKRHEVGANFIQTLRVRNTMGFDHWQHFTAYKVDKIDLERLKSIIKNKEKLLKTYAMNFDEHWLLLISNIGTQSSSNRFDFLDLGTIDTHFHKVYVLKEIGGEVIVIK